MHSILLFSDTHFTDNPLESYRWLFIEKQLPELIVANNISHVFGLGDVVDRRDRHSGNFINRLVNALLNLKKLGVSIHILKGNHDAPINSIPYWSFLNDLGIDYITKAQDIGGGILCLPFSSNPLNEWKDINLSSFKMILMHQTLTGALIEGGRKIEEAPQQLPLFPRGIPIYSGDVHCPQQLNSVTYVGCPYPTRFGESWGGRIILLSPDDYKTYKEIQLDCIERVIIDLNSSTIDSFGGRLTTLGKGDQVRVRFHLAVNDLTLWPSYEQSVKNKANSIEVQLLSIEPLFSEVVSSNNKTLPTNTGLEVLSKEETLRLFGIEEHIPEDILATGLEILRLSSV